MHFYALSHFKTYFIIFSRSFFFNHKMNVDTWQVVISWVSPVEYFNIYCVCSTFRKFLRAIYKQNPSLRENFSDVLSLIIFKQKVDVKDTTLFGTIISGLYQYPHTNKDRRHLVRSLLCFDISYNEHIFQQLSDYLFLHDEYEILKHVSKSNSIFLYNEVLSRSSNRELTEKEEEFFEYLFNECIIFKSQGVISRLALDAAEDKRIDLFLKFYKLCDLRNLVECMAVFVKQNDLATIGLLLEKQKFNNKTYTLLWEASNTGDRNMQDLIKSHCYSKEQRGQKRRK